MAKLADYDARECGNCKTTSFLDRGRLAEAELTPRAQCIDCRKRRWLAMACTVLDFGKLELLLMTICSFRSATVKL